MNPGTPASLMLDLDINSKCGDIDADGPVSSISGVDMIGSDPTVEDVQCSYTDDENFLSAIQKSSSEFDATTLTNCLSAGKTSTPAAAMLAETAGTPYVAVALKTLAPLFMVGQNNSKKSTGKRVRADAPALVLPHVHSALAAQAGAETPLKRPKTGPTSLANSETVGLNWAATPSSSSSAGTKPGPSTSSTIVGTAPSIILCENDTLRANTAMATDCSPDTSDFRVAVLDMLNKQREASAVLLKELLDSKTLSAEAHAATTEAVERVGRVEKQQQKSEAAHRKLDDKVERLRRLNDVIIRGVPLCGNESDRELRDMLLCIATGLDCVIDGRDVEFVRVLSSLHAGNTSRMMLVRFSTVALRREFFGKYIAMEGGLRASCLGRSDDEHLYISDNLTGRNAAIRRRAVALLREGRLQRHFVREGLVHVIVAGDDGNRQRPIFSLEELETMCASDLQAVSPVPLIEGNPFNNNNNNNGRNSRGGRGRGYGRGFGRGNGRGRRAGGRHQ